MLRGEFPQCVNEKLRLAGWSTDRDVFDEVRLPAHVALFPEAKRIITIYGNLRFGNRNEHVLLDPIAALEEDDTLLGRCQYAVGCPLYPVGYQEHQDRESVFVDEAGHVYMNFGETLFRIADSFEAALAYLSQAGFARTAEGRLNSEEIPSWSIERDRV